MAAFGTTVRRFGGLAMDRDVFRQLLPDDRWYLYAAGVVDPGDANIATIALVYLLDDTTTVTLTSTTKTGSGLQKWTLGPVSLFEVVGVPAGETVPVVYLTGVKDSGADGSLLVGCILPRYLASRQ